MAMGIIASVAQVISTMRDLAHTVHADSPYTCLADAGGRVPQLEHLVGSGALRAFDVRPGNDARDGGMTGNQVRRVVGLTVRVLYPLAAFSGDIDATLLQAHADAATLHEALFDPSNYDEATTGLESISEISGPSLDPVTADDADDGYPTDLMATHTMMLYYRRA